MKREEIWVEQAKTEENQRVKIDSESFSAGEVGRERWGVERKQLVKAELLLKGGMVLRGMK